MSAIIVPHAYRSTLQGAADFGSQAAMRPLRVLTFTSLFPSSVQPTHGLFVWRRLKELVATGGVEATVVAPVPWFPSGNERFRGYAELARIPMHEHWGGMEVLHPRHLVLPRIGMNVAPALMVAGVWRTVEQLHRIHRFDLIDAHYFFPDGVAAAWIAARLRIPLAITARGTDLNLISRFGIPRRQIRWAAGISQLNIAVSRALAARLTAIGADAGSVRVLPNGVDLELFRPLPIAESRSQLGMGEGPSMLCVGHLLPSKGQDVAVRALPQLPGWQLLIAGHGPDEARLRRIVDECGVSGRVTFAGRVDPGQLARYYSAADVLVLASEREGMPNVLLESLACGTPVIASAVGGCPEVVSTAVAGRLLAERSAQCLVAAVRELHAARPSREEVRRFAERFGWQSSIEAQLTEFRHLARKVAG